MSENGYKYLFLYGHVPFPYFEGSRFCGSFAMFDDFCEVVLLKQQALWLICGHFSVLSRL